MTNDLFKKLLAHGGDESPAALLTHAAPRTAWMETPRDGQLAVDVYRAGDAIIIEAPIAGVASEDIDIAINHDMVTIRAARTRATAPSPDDFFYQECYWGSFSRSIILPTDVRTDEATATMDRGVLRITLPTAPRARQLKVESPSL